MGEEAFGILTLLWAAIGYFSLFDFGLGRALTQIIAAERSAQATVQAALLRTGLLGALLPGVLGGAMLWLLAPYLVYDALNISVPLQAQALGAFRIAAVSIPLVTLGSGMRGALEGFENFRHAALIRGLLGTLNFVGPWLLVVYGQGQLVEVAWALMLARLLSLLQNALYLYQNEWAGSPSFFEKAVWQRLWGFGSWMTLSNIVGPLMVTVDRYFLAAWVGASVVAYYTVPQDLVVRLLLVPVALSTSLFPRISTYWQGRQTEAIGALMRKSTRLLALIMGSLVLALMLLAKPALGWWLGPDFAAAAWQAAVILLAGMFFNSLGLLPLTALQAAGKVKQSSLLHLLEFALYFPALWLGVQWGGLTGAAIVWSLRTTVDYLFMQYLWGRAYRGELLVHQKDEQNKSKYRMSQG